MFCPENSVLHQHAVNVIFSYYKQHSIISDKNVEYTCNNMNFEHNEYQCNFCSFDENTFTLSYFL